VFAYVVDATNLTSWQRNTVSAVPDGPMGLGTKIRELHRAPGGKQIATVVEVVEYEPDRVFGMRIIEGVPVHGRITFEPPRHRHALQVQDLFRANWDHAHRPTDHASDPQMAVRSAAHEPQDPMSDNL
jgi:hypothetical protein